MGKVNLAVYKGDLGFAIYKKCFLIHEYMYFQIISSLRGLFEEKKIMPKSTTFEIYPIMDFFPHFYHKTIVHTSSN